MLTDGFLKGVENIGPYKGEVDLIGFKIYLREPS